MAKSTNTALPPIAGHDFYKTNGLSADQTGTPNGEPSMTRQEFADECNINKIMERYDGYLADPMRSMRPPMYLDFTDLPDTLMGTMQMVQDAAEAFMRLPAIVRREFDNDPVAFADYAADPTNLEQMRTWGLAPPAKVPDAPLKVEVINPPASGQDEPKKP